MQTNIKLSVKQKHNFGHHMLEIAASSNIILIRKEKVKIRNGYRTYSFVEFHPEVLKELHNRHEILQNSTLVYRPMISPPIDHSLVCSGGFIHTNLRKPVIQRYRDNFFGDQQKPQKFSEPSELVLNGLNSLMKTEWSINEDVLEVMKTLFENNSGLANLPHYSFEEFMYSTPYPTDGSKEEQAKWMQDREEMWGTWYKDEQKRGRMLVRLKLAEDLIPWDYFYHVWTLDFRGRGYTVCELLSPQSSDFDRGLITLATRKKLTPEGEYWRKVHLANLFDQDKISFEQRVQWVDDNWALFLRIKEDPYHNLEWVDNAKKKNKSFQRLAAILDITNPDGCSNIPVQLDGKCNGNQHWSAIMRDGIIAHLTGVLPSDQPEDLYQHVADNTTDYCELKTNENSWFKQFVDYWDGGIPRSVTKRSTMCEAYGLTFYGIQKYLRSEGHLDWVPKEKRGGAIVELARAIKAALDRTLINSNTGKNWLKDVSNIASEQNKHLTWVTPSGFKVVHYYTKTQTRRSVAKLFNKKELHFFVQTDDPNPRAARQAIAPNYIHSLDAAHMFLTIQAMVDSDIKDFSMIHDSYGCHPNDVVLMKSLINREFLKMHEENCLLSFKKDVENHLGLILPDPPPTGGFKLERVLDSEYFFA
jgi:DNA-directed RNA polymerase